MGEFGYVGKTRDLVEFGAEGFARTIVVFILVLVVCGPCLGLLRRQ